VNGIKFHQIGVPIYYQKCELAQPTPLVIIPAVRKNGFQGRNYTSLMRRFASLLWRGRSLRRTL
jgi:hypothetical protein